MKKKWIVAAIAACVLALLAAGCDNGSNEPDEQEEPGLVYQDGWLLAGSTVRQYRGTETSVTTPAGVTRIGEHAFENCTDITAVTIGDGVTVIDDYAFYGCENLAEVTIPASVALIGSGTIGQWCAVDGIGAVAGAEHVTVAGEDLNGRTTLAIPDGTKTIAAGAFYYCEDLTNVTLPASVTRIGGAAFRGYTALKVLQFSGTKAQWQAIEGCDTVAVPCIQCSDGHLGVKDVPGYLKIYGTKVTDYTDDLPASLVIPDGVTSIGWGAFYGCTSLASVTIPASVTEIGDSAFSSCDKLTDVTYGGTLAQWCAVDDVSDLMSYAERVTMGDGTDLKRATTIVIPDGVTSIGMYAFYRCENLATVTIPASVTSIGWGAFLGCMSLATVTIPASVTSIGQGAFYECTSLASVTIPASVTSIRRDAFNGCTSLASVTYGGTKEDWSNIEKGSSIFSNTNVTEITGKDGTFTVNSSGSITE